MQEPTLAFLEQNIVHVISGWKKTAEARVSLYVPAEEVMFDEHVTDAFFQRPTQVSLHRQFPVLWQTKCKLSQNSAMQFAVYYTKSHSNWRP